MPRRKTKDEFVKESNKIHNNVYDYSKVEYTNNRTKVCIICPIHGEFFMRPDDHLHGHGCPKCSKHYNYTTEDFIKAANIVHKNKYDYSKVEYKNAFTKICIICPKHGEFWQLPYHHLQGHGCKQCQYENNISSTLNINFAKDAENIHNGKYDYSNVKYVNNHTKVCIICPFHGEFWQTPHDHLQNHGCPYCRASKLEKNVRKYLSENNILFEEQKRFKWLGLQSLDFYLPKYNIAIECQGIQHFESIEYFGGDKSFYERIKRDNEKKKLCEENNVIILYYSELESLPTNVITSKDELLKKILLYEP